MPVACMYYACICCHSNTITRCLAYSQSSELSTEIKILPLNSPIAKLTLVQHFIIH